MISATAAVLIEAAARSSESALEAFVPGMKKRGKDRGPGQRLQERFEQL